MSEPRTSDHLEYVMQRVVKKWTRCLVFAGLAAAWPQLSRSAPLQADTVASQFVVRADRRGLLSAFAHDHLFTPARWRAEADFDPARPQEVRVDVRVDAATMHDHVARLTQGSRDYVDRETIGPEVLDAQRYPEIRFHGESASARRAGDRLDGVLHGALSLHGTTRPLDVPFHARVDAAGYRVSGSVRFRQTDFGMKPFSRAGGAFSVDDEIQVDFELALAPAAGAAGGVTRLGAQ
jgi:polyisoprenoid-binding protein YceI